MLYELIPNIEQMSRWSIEVKLKNLSNLCFYWYWQLGKVSKDTCGGASYKAGKFDSINGRAGLADTGVVFCTCRHGFLLRGVNMTKGETYRHVHYLHDYALVNGCQFFCYDVVCKYWSFAEDLSKANSEFKPHTENMQPFLSRWHGKTHAWYCQVKLFKCQFITFRLITFL